MYGGGLPTLNWKSSEPHTIQFFRAMKRPADSVRCGLFVFPAISLLTSHRNICELERLDNRLIQWSDLAIFVRKEAPTPL
jgi:hypothetical protein